MKLRPHHILCIQKFTGHGYDAEFTAHMTSIVSTLFCTTDTEISVAEGCDELCASCPHNNGGVCASLEKVAFMDRAVLDICGFSYGESIRWTDASARVCEMIFAPGNSLAFSSVCSGCEWFELCRNTDKPRCG